MNECSSGRLVSFLVEGDDVVSCEVCLEPFQPVLRPPKILPCGHNFCDQCLFSLCCHQQYYLLDSIKCPTCRASFSAEAAKSAPTNWD
ncbi:zinc finger, C3HC4 type, partial [Oesophagostomum dentatum]